MRELLFRELQRREGRDGVTDCDVAVDGAGTGAGAAGWAGGNDDDDDLVWGWGDEGNDENVFLMGLDERGSGGLVGPGGREDAELDVGWLTAPATSDGDDAFVGGGLRPVRPPGGEAGGRSPGLGGGRSSPKPSGPRLFPRDNASFVAAGASVVGGSAVDPCDSASLNPIGASPADHPQDLPPASFRHAWRGFADPARSAAIAGLRSPFSDPFTPLLRSHPRYTCDVCGIVFFRAADTAGHLRSEGHRRVRDTCGRWLCSRLTATSPMTDAGADGIND